MSPEQQRDIDQAIIAGRLVDAIARYRAATGRTLAEAQAYVTQRNAEMLGGVPAQPIPSPPTASPSFVSVSPAASAAAAGSIVKWVLSFVAIVVVVSLAVPLLTVWFTLTKVMHVGNPLDLAHGIASIATIVHEPYYPDVVREIRKDRHFQQALGTPIAVDDSSVACSYISDDSVQHKANCDIPVHGPKAAGSIRVQIVDQASTLDLGAWLRIGDRTIPINS